MESMTDVLFYKDKISTVTIIEGFKNILNAPAVGDEVMINEKVYVVVKRVFDFDGNTIHVVVNSINKKFR